MLLSLVMQAVQSCQTKEMSQSENRGLALGILAGTAGLSLAFVWYRVWKPRSTMCFPIKPAVRNLFHSTLSETTSTNRHGPVLQGTQLQMLHKLGSLLESMEELKEEVKLLKEAIPELKEQILNELKIKTDAHRISPLHRATKRKRVETKTPTEHPSSEEAESEGGYMTAHTDPEVESENEKKQAHLPTDILMPCPEAVPLMLLQQADRLHDGSELSKQQGFRLMIETEEKVGKRHKPEPTTPQKSAEDKTEPDTLQTVLSELRAIRDTVNETKEDTTDIKSDLTSLKQELEKLADRVAVVESSQTSTQAVIKSLQGQGKKVVQLEKDLEDLQLRSRRNNLRV
uniref:Regulator of microtubule dynamics protein 2 isoform X6 n=1 Tax=Geotrypetes seraphini TaxID=260995 RepID=A0A6P8PXF9_GEOSA|nr:regulator of microtubule dynamics protein 2 isoform X6 [Geotrypetes seraphini]